MSYLRLLVASIIVVMPLLGSGQSPCDLPPEAGPCLGAFTRYFYNNDVQDCQTFTYGGCNGNANNYMTYEACIESCGTICQLPANPGPCLAAIPRWYYSTASETCLGFTYGGCGGNANNYISYEACIQSCGTTCQLPADRGPCKGAFTRWYYNVESGHCETFTYGGCGGNDNNYPSQTVCMESCGDVCYLPFESGPCAGFFPRYYYNPIDQNCQLFIYGGCGGNGNNHMTYEACMSSCAPVCKQPQVVGPCRAEIPRYYYDQVLNGCVSFMYGGCGGNDNNFLTLTACLQACDCTSDISDDQLYIANVSATLSVSNSLSSISVVQAYGHLMYSATAAVELNSGFRIDSAGTLEVVMEGCID